MVVSYRFDPAGRSLVK